MQGTILTAAGVQRFITVGQRQQTCRLMFITLQTRGQKTLDEPKNPYRIFAE